MRINANYNYEQENNEISIASLNGFLDESRVRDIQQEQDFPRKRKTRDPKRAHGQFFTTTNPFFLEPFYDWFRSTPAFSGRPILEPFAGANNIVKMIRDVGHSNEWACFDIDPVNGEGNTTGDFIRQRDTLLGYPQGFEVAITNPPYLAKNSATRRGLGFPSSKHDDLYKEALDVMLAGTPFVAAIVPESFLTQGLFHSRLSAVISLPCKMFEDTECPVCLALFVPEEAKFDAKDFLIYSGPDLIGSYLALQEHGSPFISEGLPWKFNDPDGSIGLLAIDGQVESSIRFVRGDEISPFDVKATSRSKTRIGGLHRSRNAERIVEEANKILAERRSATGDVFMTAFKGLRKDGKFRRRLDFAQARDILNMAAANVEASLKKAA